MINEVDDTYHLRELLPTECIDECSCSGDNYSTCECWVEELGLQIPREQCLKEIKEYFTDCDEDLEDQSDLELNIKFLWLACGHEV